MRPWVAALAFLLVGSPASAASFSTLTPLPERFHSHGFVASNGFLYHLGGLGNAGVGSARNVYYAPLQADGTIGAWTAGPLLPEAVFSHGAVAVNGTLYVLGGHHYNGGITTSKVVYYSRIGEDGAPGAWQTANALPEAVFYLSAAAHNGTIYVTGGWNGLGLTRGVYSADAQPDGSLSAWRSEAQLPEAVYTHAAVSNGTLYVLGGVVNNGTQIYNAVYYARINADKTLAPWQTGTPLPQALSNHAGIVANGRVFVAGGWTGTMPTNATIMAAASGDGSLGEWSAFEPLPMPLYLHAAATVGGKLYISGGSNGSGQRREVYMIPLPEAPGPSDSLPPRTALALGAPQYGAAPVFVSPATPLSLSAADDALVVGDGAGVGVASTQYAVDQGAFASYTAAFTLSGDGAKTVRFFSTDSLGHAEAEQAAAVAVDGTAPQSSWSASPAPYQPAEGAPILSAAALVSLAAADPVAGGVAAGVAQTVFSLDGGAPQAYDGPFPLSEGAHALSFHSADNVGNAEAAQSAALRVDATPPVTALEIGAGASFFGIEMITPDTAISLAAEDPVSNGVASGVDRILYSVDGGADQTYAGPFQLSAGAHTVAFNAVDHAGNAEERRSVGVSIGSLLTDSIAAYESVTLSGGAGVVGNVRTNGTFTANGNSSVSGQVISGQPTLPPNLFDLAAAKAYAQEHDASGGIPSRFMNAGALVLNGHDSLDLAAGVYHFTGLSVTGQARLSAAGALVFVSGRIQVSGGGAVNESGQAAGLWIASDGVEASMSGGARGAFHLVAPRASVSFSGGGQHAGRVLGRTVSLSGRALQGSDERLSPRRLPGVRRHLARGQGRSGSGNSSQGICQGAACAGGAPAAPARPASRVGNAPPALSLGAEAALSLVTGAGSSVRTEQGGGVVIPPGAVTAGLAVTVAPESTADAADLLRREKNAERKALRTAAAAVEYGPHGAQFAKPVTLELPYSRAALPAGVSEAGLAVHYWNAGTGEWEQLPSSVDTVAQVVRAQTNHFSLYGLFSGGAPSATAGFSFGEVYAYPNPGPAPKIRAEAPGAETIQIRVYDASGELKHSAEISGGSADHPVGGLSSGVYIFTVTANKSGQGAIRQTGRLAVVR